MIGTQGKANGRWKKRERMVYSVIVMYILFLPFGAYSADPPPVNVDVAPEAPYNKRYATIHPIMAGEVHTLNIRSKDSPAPPAPDIAASQIAPPDEVDTSLWWPAGIATPGRTHTYYLFAVNADVPFAVRIEGTFVKPPSAPTPTPVSVEGTQAAATPGFEVNMVRANLIIHNGLEGVSGGQAILEADEETIGAVTVANLNNTDGDDKTPDRDDNDVSVSGPNPPGRKEHDLMKLVLEEPQRAGTVAKVRVRVVSGDVKIYKPGPPGMEQSKINGEATLTQATSAFTTDSDANGTKDIVWWVEARAQTALQGIELAYEWQATAGSPWILGDTVKATGLWVENTSGSPWRIRETTSGPPNNPKVGVGNDVPDCDEYAVVNGINNVAISVDGSRYGYGRTYRNSAGTADRRIGGRILWEFEIKPHGVEALGVVFDITRQVENQAREILNGSGTMDPIAAMPNDFPENNTPKKDNETPNDDNDPTDEDDDPLLAGPPPQYNHHLYSFDGPSHSINADNDAFVMWRAHFREWARVRFSGNFLNLNDRVEGSRASDKYDWHLLMYLKRGTSDNLVEDNAATSYSAPVLTGAGNGAMAVSLLADAVTEGFTATYDLANKKWTLTGTSGGPPVIAQVAGAVPPGTTWTLTWGTKVSVTITQGDPEFANGAKYEFSIFKTSATGGKKNEINTGLIDVNDGP